MKGFVFGLLVGIILGSGGLLYLQRERTAELERARESVGAASQDVRTYLDAKLEVLGLQAAQIRREMVEQERVIRRTARVLQAQVADATADARITVAIKSKFVADPELSALAISVSAADGVVTLSGTVADPGLVGRAMVHALETEGVREAVSTIRVREE